MQSTIQQKDESIYSRYVFHNPETGKDINLSPRNVMAARYEKDITSGYALNHSLSIRTVKRNPSLTRYRLSTQGYDCVPAISEETASALMNYLKTEHLDKQRPEASPFQESFPLKEKRLFMDLLEEVFRDEIDDMILSYFQSEYAILFCSMVITYPVGGREVPIEQVSFRWHCDTSPEYHLKVLVHLNDVREHHGGTRCINIEQTRPFKDIGYAFNVIYNRLSDLTELARQFNITYEEELIRPKTGEAIIFQPGQVLHRGSWPDKAARYLVNLGVVPWQAHWRTMADQHYDVIVNNMTSTFLELKQD